MEPKQNKILLPSAVPKNTPAHQCSGPVHPNSKGHSAQYLWLRRHSRTSQGKEANFMFGKIILEVFEN